MSGRRAIPLSTASASAICGTALGWTKLVTSMRPRPVAASASTNAIFVSVGTNVGSDCSPSRGLTSVTRTRAGSFMGIVPPLLRLHGAVAAAEVEQRLAVASAGPLHAPDEDRVVAALVGVLDRAVQVADSVVEH